MFGFWQYSDIRISAFHCKELFVHLRLLKDKFPNSDSKLTYSVSLTSDAFKEVGGDGARTDGGEGAGKAGGAGAQKTGGF